MDYDTLNAMAPETFLKPENFVTTWDRADYGNEQFASGLKTSREAKTIYINASGTWGADMLSGAALSAYEGIGYHANTADLLRGFLAGPAPIVVYRRSRSRTEIKGRTG